MIGLVLLVALVAFAAGVAFERHRETKSLSGNVFRPSRSPRAAAPRADGPRVRTVTIRPTQSIRSSIDPSAELD